VELKNALSASATEAALRQVMSDRMTIRRKELEHSTKGVILPNPGGGDCLLFVTRQMREQLFKPQQILGADIPLSTQRDTPSAQLLRERETLLQITIELHKAYVANLSSSSHEKLRLTKSLNTQVRARKFSGIFMGSFIQDGVPTEVDALASTFSIQFDQHWLVINGNGDDVPLWTTRHGNSSNPEAPFALLFTETIGLQAGHFELLSLTGTFDLQFQYSFTNFDPSPHKILKPPKSERETTNTL
jgi:hypothetical protein